MSNSHKIALWNANGLVQRRQETELFLHTQKIDILLVSETHFTDKNYFNIPGYKCYSTQHPDGTAHGGTAILIKQTLQHHELEKYEKDFLQATSIQITDKNGARLTVSTIYCPPRHAITKDEFSTFFETLGPKFIAGGDFNAKHSSWGSRVITPKGRNLLKTITAKGYNTLSTRKPTYWPTDPNRLPDLLDFFILNGLTHSYSNIEECLDLSSDHTPVIATISSTLIKIKTTPMLCNKKTNWTKFQQTIENKLNIKMPLKTKEDIETAIEHFNTTIQDAAHTSTPKTTIRENIFNYPIEITKKLKEKRKLRKIWQTTHYPPDKSNFNKASKELKNLIIKNKNDTLQDFLSKLSPQGNNEHSVWKATKFLKRPKTFISPIKSNVNTWARTNSEKAEVFSKFLEETFNPFPQSCSKEENTEIEEFLYSPLQLSIPIRPFSTKEIEQIIKIQNNKRKSPGYDLITMEIIKKLPKKSLTFLRDLFNSIIRTSYVPTQFKIAHIIMILKPGKPESEPSSYRPISLLPQVSKLFEKLLLIRLKSDIEIDDIIPDHQFGFRNQHSTTEQIHRIVNIIQSSLEEKKICSGVFLDVKKAFDKVWHQGLLHKIKKHLPDHYYWIFKSYLEDRWFQVKIENDFSEFRQIRSGVPQGSILGPFLYSLYTGDIPTSNDTFIATYADDTAILVTSDNPDSASHQLQEELDTLQKWLHKWRIHVNETKSTHITFTNKKITCPPVSLNSKTIPNSNSVKYLGMHLDTRLTWKTHLDKKHTEINLKYKKMYWLIGRKSQLSLKTKTILYQALLKPIWYYACQIWATASESNISKIQRIQSKILRSISNAPWFMTNEALHDDLFVPSVREVIFNTYKRHIRKLEIHTNTSAITLLDNSQTVRRLKKKPHLGHPRTLPDQKLEK